LATPKNGAPFTQNDTSNYEKNALVLHAKIENARDLAASGAFRMIF